MTKKFTKKKEDFTCDKCKFEVRGDGYTDHCSNCLWSKHVDINPGDRMAICQGLMKPVKIEVKKDKYRVTNKCDVCGYEKTNTLAPDDNWDEVIKIQQQFVLDAFNNGEIK
jgi:hypothetical protein